MLPSTKLLTLFKGVGGGVAPPVDPVANEILWLPSMLSRDIRGWWTASDPTSFRKQDGSQCAATDACWTWRDSSGKTTRAWYDVTVSGKTGTFVVGEKVSMSTGGHSTVAAVSSGSPSQLFSAATITATTTVVTGLTSGATATVATVSSHAGSATAGVAQDIVAMAASAGAGTGVNAGVFGKSGKDSATGIKGLSSNNVTTVRFGSPNGVWPSISGSRHTLFVLGRVRPPGAASQRVIVANGSGNFAYNLRLSATVVGQITGAADVGTMGTADGTEHMAMMRQVSPLLTAVGWAGSLDGDESIGPDGGGANLTDTRLYLFNSQSNSTALDGEIFEVLLFEGQMTRANQHRYEGWAAHYYEGAGASNRLPAGHPYKAAPPTVPFGTTSTVDWDEPNFVAAAAKQTFVGYYIEGQTDSYDGNASASHLQPTDSTTEVWGFPYSLTAPMAAAIKADLFPGNGEGITYLYLPSGFAYRGLRNIDGVSGLAKNIGERFTGQNAAIAAMLSNTGVKLAFQYHSPAPHWKMSSSYAATVTGPSLWAGGSFARTRSLATLKATVTMTIATPGVVTFTAHGFAADTPVKFSTTGALPTGILAGTTYYVRNPATNTFEVALTPGGVSIITTGTQSGVHKAWATQYDTQIAAFSAAVVDDMEYQHQNIAPIGMFGLQNEAANPASAGYGHNLYATDQEYSDILSVLLPLIDASTILPALSDIHVHIDSWQGGSTNGNSFATANPTMVNGLTQHRIVPIYTDADSIRTGIAGWQSIGTYGGVVKPQWINEFEYFDLTGISTGQQFANTCLVFAHMFALGNAPYHTPILHFMKQIGLTSLSSNTLGYGLTKARLPAPFADPPSTPGDPDPTIGHGEYAVIPANYNAYKWMADNFKPGSVRAQVDYGKLWAAGTAVVAAKVGGKKKVGIVNRTASDMTVTISLDGPAAVIRGKRYSDSAWGTVLTPVNASAINVTVPAYSAEVWAEQ